MRLVNLGGAEPGSSHKQEACRTVVAHRHEPGGRRRPAISLRIIAAVRTFWLRNATQSFPRNSSRRNNVSDQKIIFSMVGVGKVYKPNHQVLKDIYLSFYYGAKIGVLGQIGVVKSTLLRIITGLHQDYVGEIQAQTGFTFGYLPTAPDTRAHIGEVQAS